MEKLTLETVRLYEDSVLRSMALDGVPETLMEVLRIDLQIVRFARRVLEAQAKGGKMVSPDVTDLMWYAGRGAGITSFERERTFRLSGIFAAMHATAPDMLEDKNV